MKPMEPYVKKFFGYLEEGKIMGQKCNRCGAYSFPPITACDNCGGTVLDWAEMNPEGELELFSLALYPDPPFMAFAPYLYGQVRLKDGPRFTSMILGANLDELRDLYTHLPVPVTAEVFQLEGYKIVAYRIQPKAGKCQ